MRPRVIRTGTSEQHVKQKKGGMRMRLSNAEKDLKGEFNGCVFDAFLVEWSLNSCKFQVCNSFFCF